MPIAHFFRKISAFPAGRSIPRFDPVNALLNYGYGILYGRIEGELIKTGIDPYVGVLHRDNYNRPVLVYDVIERYRIWIDFVVAHLVCQRVVTDDLYSVQADGCLLAGDSWEASVDTIGQRLFG